MIKHATHPNGLLITFSDQNHQYRINQTGEIPISGTTFINQFFEKFDADAIAAKCVGKPKYAGMTADEIKEQWRREGEQASTWGDHTHAFAEALFKGRDLPNPVDQHEDCLFDQAVRAVLRLSERFEFLEAEKIVFSPKFGIAGMIDLVMLDHQLNHIIVLDWKTNREFTMDNIWQKALPPIQHLDDCHFTKYSLQLTLYRTILSHENYYPTADGFRTGIIHLTEDGSRFIKPKDLITELTWMFIKHDQGVRGKK